jgi:hypothetical protein
LLKIAISVDTPIGYVGTMPDASGAGAHPRGDAIAKRFGAEIHSAIDAGSIKCPLAIA